MWVSLVDHSPWERAYGSSNLSIQTNLGDVLREASAPCKHAMRVRLPTSPPYQHAAVAHAGRAPGCHPGGSGIIARQSLQISMRVWYRGCALAFQAREACSSHVTRSSFRGVSRRGRSRRVVSAESSRVRIPPLPPIPVSSWPSGLGTRLLSGFTQVRILPTTPRRGNSAAECRHDTPEAERSNRSLGTNLNDGVA